MVNNKNTCLYLKSGQPHPGAGQGCLLNRLGNSIELTKDCCAFANTDGGFIIFGVREEGHHFNIVGIDNDKDFANRFGQKINALPTNPLFQLGDFVPIPDSEKVLGVVHVPRSYYRPHIPSQQGLRIFWKRTNTGNEQMTYEEIRESFRRVLTRQRRGTRRDRI